MTTEDIKIISPEEKQEKFKKKAIKTIGFAICIASFLFMFIFNPFWAFLLLSFEVGITLMRKK